jgi:chaperonin GroEL
MQKIKATGDIKTGIDILQVALEKPIRIIAKNSGVEGAVILDKIKSSDAVDFGYDADKGVFGSMLAAGIMDPAKVTRAAVENAVSVAAMVLTTEVLITDIPEDKPMMAPPPPMDY